MIFYLGEYFKENYLIIEIIWRGIFKFIYNLYYIRLILNEKCVYKGIM